MQASSHVPPGRGGHTKPAFSSPLPSLPGRESHIQIFREAFPSCARCLSWQSLFVSHFLAGLPLHKRLQLDSLGSGGSWAQPPDPPPACRPRGPPPSLLSAQDQQGKGTDPSWLPGWWRERPQLLPSPLALGGTGHARRGQGGLQSLFLQHLGPSCLHAITLHEAARGPRGVPAPGGHVVFAVKSKINNKKHKSVDTLVPNRPRNKPLSRWELTLSQGHASVSDHGGAVGSMWGPQTPNLSIKRLNSPATTCCVPGKGACAPHLHLKMTPEKVRQSPAGRNETPRMARMPFLPHGPLEAEDPAWSPGGHGPQPDHSETPFLGGPGAAGERAARRHCPQHLAVGEHSGQSPRAHSPHASSQPRLALLGSVCFINTRH